MTARSALALAFVLGCGSHSATTDGAPPLGDCRCDDATGDGSAGGGADAAPDAPADAPTCDTTPSCPAGQWCTETAPIASTILLGGVWAIDNNDVFAVGNSGTILRRRCNTWTAMTSGTTANLHAVWASATDVWAVGDAGTILRFDGTQWQAVTGVTTADLYAVSGTSSSDVWIVGGSGQGYRWDGASWATKGIGGNLLGVAGTGDGDVWITGEIAYVRHCDAAALWGNTTPCPELQPEGASNGDYLAIVERSPTNVWVASATGTTLDYNGTTWTAHATGGAIFSALWARSDTDLWGAGQRSVGHWNGTSWSVATPPGVTMSLFGVGGTATDVYVVGAGATILHQD